MCIVAGEVCEIQYRPYLITPLVFVTLFLSKGRKAVRRICECNQSGCRDVFDPEPVMSNLGCGGRGVLRRRHVKRMSLML